MTQVDPWAGEFGDAYHARNSVTPRVALWADVLPRIIGHPHILEIGAGLGSNLEAIRQLRPGAKLYAVEPNLSARHRLNRQGFVTLNGSASKVASADGAFDLVFTYGVLIHMTSEVEVLAAMREMVRLSRRYMLMAEYFAPTREKITYRNTVPLYRADYGRHMIERFKVKHVAHGFCWKPATGLDNVTWWLFQL